MNIVANILILVSTLAAAVLPSSLKMAGNSRVGNMGGSHSQNIIITTGNGQGTMSGGSVGTMATFDQRIPDNFESRHSLKNQT